MKSIKKIAFSVFIVCLIGLFAGHYGLDHPTCAIHWVAWRMFGTSFIGAMASGFALLVISALLSDESKEKAKH